jgi:hypothetical protein
MAAGLVGGGGLAGRTTGAVGTTVGAGLGAAGSATGSLAASGAVALQAGALVRLPASTPQDSSPPAALLGLRDLTFLERGLGCLRETNRRREADAAEPTGTTGSSSDKR